ncbi:hypothetical protein Vadar_020705 [Vaccinium darrowii]|uniref:Uncharacterized protein n=1 Tax=Vaccinium darrowii TaxID=229202 RepID=A0ACB7ZMY5_9ERIC|nr:hypothetical protein Vadar_020705 [Vaccinium darrowii]
MGPEVLSKFVGATEKNARDLFAGAEQDQRTLGDQSELRVVIFDEIDAICKLSRNKSATCVAVSSYLFPMRLPLVAYLLMITIMAIPICQE